MSAFHNNALIGSSNQGYTISRSVRLRSSASAYFSRTLTTPTSQNVWSFSCWVKRGSLADAQFIFWAGTSATNDCALAFDSSDKLLWFTNNGSSVLTTSTAVFRDPSAWYHIVAIANSTTMNVYVNNQQVITNAGMTNNTINSAIVHNIGRDGQTAGNEFDGYLTEINFIDGQALTPSSFGETNAVTGVWQPKRYAGTYGTNGFYLNFSDNSGVTATTIGKDYSGNGNNWTPSAGISITAGATYDSMLDVPTPYADGGNGRGNYAVLNPLWKGSGSVITDGNLNNTPTTAVSAALTTMPMSTGKWYSEISHTASNISALAMFFTADNLSAPSFTIGSTTQTGLWEWYDNGAGVYVTSDGGAFGSSIRSSAFRSAGTFQFALDCDSGKFWFGKDNVWYDSTGGTTGNPSTGANPTFTISTARGPFNFGVGQNGGYVTMSLNCGQRAFSYTPPTGFVALNTQNLPAVTIANPKKHFDVLLYAGNAASPRTITGAEFQPDLIWDKSRSARSHTIWDSVRGVGVSKELSSNLTDAEGGANISTAVQGYISAITADGFTMTSGSSAINAVNANGENFVAWLWNAGGSTVTNTSGTISAQVRANPTAGFSVVTWTHNNSTATIGHGLGIAPQMIIAKTRNGVNDWFVYTQARGATKTLYLNLTNAEGTTSAVWGNTAPTSTVFTASTTFSTNTCVAYCFAAVAGYSAFGSYTGNGSTDGPFVYLGFRPRWVMIKRTDSAGFDWNIVDTSRNTYNVTTSRLWADLSNAEDSTDNVCDITSNGFKLRSTNTNTNASGGTYIYAAFAENPFKNSLAR